MQLTSTKNPFLQDVRRAIAHGHITEQGHIVVEGPHLVRELFRSSWRLEKILVTPEAHTRCSELLAGANAEVIEVPARTFDAISGTEHSQGIMALANAPAYSWDDCLASGGAAVVLDGIQDPGNAGTIVRSAEAFGAAAVVFSEGSVHVANGKFLRATAGSIFRLPYLENGKRADILAQLKKRKRILFALTAKADVTLSSADLKQPCAVAVGSEAHGVSAELLAGARTLRIPTKHVESLNAAVACSLALFEAARQRGAV